MRSFLSQIPIQAVAVAIVAAAGIALLPSTAAATCGSYVTVVRSPDLQHHSPISAMPHELPTSPPVCHGTGCSKSPAAPVTPLSMPVNPTSELKQLSAAIERDAGEGKPSDWQLNIASNARPSRLPSSIFHPPRGN